MGLVNLFSCNSVYSPLQEIKQKQIDSLYKWKIIKSKEIGRFLIIHMKYADAVAYKGEKILVFEDVRLDELKKQKWINPHFLEKDGIYPIARFVPTDDGWHNAIVMAQAITLGG